MEKYHGSNLRRGRTSLPGYYYFITITTLDRHCWFDSFAQGAVASRSFYHPSVKKRADTLAYVVMPDHVHWILCLKGNLSEAVRSYKAQVSIKLGGSVWQRGFYDHAIRQDQSLRRIARYTIANPLRAGLVDHINDYPFWNAIWLE
ncbi:REP-associated tyrosine transposase [Halomonas llamarensis]|uniref:Transposase n=1 Tax=Halomonas llamarensis TaxID=2945104 RepID=A0ABT0SP57_9GAMM|nr:transposase [Halomonas llamarensis]MCL7929575.1 transposase [Halomonas llamarensis]